ncbi:MAG: UDP-2,3-diacylglucosamine diphosphatase [Gammaproteobacteria bacterium]
MEKKCWNTLWISDVHLGTRGCKATQLLAFLKSNTCRKLFLVGDIIDGWHMTTNKWYWPGEHNQVLRQILRKAENEQTEVCYIPGNHDEFLREYLSEHQIEIGNIKVLTEATHVTARGEKLWIIHGDAFDGVTRHHRWVALLGDAAYDFLLLSNHWFNQVRRWLRLPYWSLSGAIKHKVKSAVSFIFDFEHAVARETARRGFDGVVCGHIHHAENKLVDGIRYYNCGDWVESCTALAEDANGDIQILRWSEPVPAIDNVVQLKLPAQAKIR